MASKKLPLADLNANQVRQVHALGDAKLSERVTKLWGVVKTERDPERVKIVEQYRQVVRSHRGDAAAGMKVFEAKCAQCHTIYGKAEGDASFATLKKMEALGRPADPAKPTSPIVMEGWWA